jgi:hypothetical protein
VLDHARQFADRVLPMIDGAYINLHWSQPGQNGRRFWDGRACENIDEFVRTLNWALTTDGEKDIYVCMSAQSQMEEKLSKKGHTYKKALRSATDVVAVKSLYIDVDVKEGAYENTREALDALKEFITSASMPTPTAVVASGSGGFHVHWALDQALPREEWQHLANALARATQELGLHCDTQCTVDAARILRVPQTWNHKGDEPKPVKLLSLSAEVSLDEVREALQPWMDDAPEVPLLPMGNADAGSTAVNDELGAGIEVKAAPPIIIDEVAQHCGFVSRSLGTGGKDNDNPLWFMTAALAAHVQDGRQALHTMSDKHPTYAPEATDELFDRAVAKQKARNLGWPQCSKIAGYGAPECKSCPLLAKNKSPLNFAQVTASAVDDTLPDRFVRNPNGTIAVRAVMDDGTPFTITLTHYPIWTGWLSPDPWVLHFQTILNDNKSVLFELPAEVIGSKDGFGKYMSSKGFFVGEKEAKTLKEFFMAWIQKLQKTKRGVVSAVPFGWSVANGNIEGFAYGGNVWGKNTERPAASPGGALAYQYGPHGSNEVWTQLSRVITDQNRPGLNAILASAFAGPLVHLMGHSGLQLNAYSIETGIGKTTAMKTAQAVWGHPVMAMTALDDTKNSILGKLGKIRHLPCFWDEIKSEQQVKTFIDTVFNLSGGKERARMAQDLSLRDSGTWHTLLVSATNESLIDAMAAKNRSTAAGLVRLFEYQVPPPAERISDTGHVQQLLGKLEYNYGHAGLTYSKWLGANHEKATDEISRLHTDICAETDSEQGERMWTNVITVLLKGADYANQLGLTQINLVELKTFLLGVMSGMRKEVSKTPTGQNATMTVSQVLADFINSTRQNTLETNRTWVGRGKPPKGAIQILNDYARIQRLGVQISKEDGVMRISSSFFSEWMNKAGHSRKSFLDKMESDYGVRMMTGKLGGGTILTGANEQLIVIDMNDVKLTDILE